MCKMKNLLLTLLILFAITASAQEHIDFMGIPVDGIQAELFGKLKEKGFQETDDSNVLKGLFDDLPVEVLVLDNVRG